MPTISLSIPEPDYVRLVEISLKQNKKVSVLIREAVRYWLASQKKKGGIKNKVE